MSGLVAWFNRDIWGPIWPNLAASAICATLAVMKVRAHLKAHHETIKGEIRKALRHDPGGRR